MKTNKYIYVLTSNLGYNEYFTSKKEAIKVAEYLKENHRLKKISSNETLLNIFSEEYENNIFLKIKKQELNSFKI